MSPRRRRGRSAAEAAISSMSGRYRSPVTAPPDSCQVAYNSLTDPSQRHTRLPILRADAQAPAPAYPARSRSPRRRRRARRRATGRWRSRTGDGVLTVQVQGVVIGRLRSGQDDDLSTDKPTTRTPVVWERDDDPRAPRRRDRTSRTPARDMRFRFIGGPLPDRIDGPRHRRLRGRQGLGFAAREGSTACTSTGLSP